MLIKIAGYGGGEARGRGTNEYIAQVHHMVRLSKAKWTKST